MARPTKQGIDYFPLDCQFDDKTQMYLIEKGAVGLAVLITVWQMIYVNEGYYIANNRDLHLLVKQRIDVDVNEVSECINICLFRNLFSEEKHKKYGILTSKATQRRYLEAAKKKKEIQFDVNYALIDVSDVENLVNVAGNATKEEVEEKEKEKTPFTEFWSVYPRKDNKQSTEKIWKRLSEQKRKLAIADCQTRYQHTEKKFIPLPSTYLNGSRWQDEPVAAAGGQASPTRRPFPS